MTGRKPDLLWRQLEDHPDLIATRREWEQLLGADLTFASRYLKSTGKIASTWVCGRNQPGCFRQVIQHAPDRIVAVCPERRCDKVQVQRDALRLQRLELKRLVKDICVAIGLDGKEVEAFGGGAKVGGQPSTLRLGARTFGVEDVVFYFARDAAAARLLPLIEKMRLRDLTARVALLVPRDDGVDLVARAAARREGIDVLALDRIATTSDRRLVVDLAAFVIEHRFAELDPIPFLWPRYWLVLDPQEGRYWYAGGRVAFSSRTRLPTALLIALARSPRQKIVRKDLYPAIWPDDWGRDGFYIKDLDRRIRDLKSKLSRLLKQAADGQDGVPADPVKAIPGSDIEGGYVLDIPESRVLWWSEPAA